MRKLIVIAFVIVLLAGAVAGYFLLTTPRSAATITFPLSSVERTLLASVPAEAEMFAYVPNAAALQSTLRSNPVTRDAVERLATSQPLPRPWMLGGADLLIWRIGKKTTYYVRLDPVRAAIARVYLTLRGDTGQSGLLIGAPQLNPIAGGELQEILALSERLPRGNALVVQRERRARAFPPLQRPAVSSVALRADVIEIVSRGRIDPRSEPAAAGTPLAARAARDAILTASFNRPPRAVGDLDRLLGASASRILESGGSIVLYEVESRRLLPRPKLVLVVPATPERQAALAEIRSSTVGQVIAAATDSGIQTAERDGLILIAFDRDSIPRYERDTHSAMTHGATEWALRVDAERAVPILEQLASNTGLRFLTPRLHRSARDLETWIGDLRQASDIEAGLSRSGAEEELRVRIVAK